MTTFAKIVVFVLTVIVGAFLVSHARETPQEEDIQSLVIDSLERSFQTRSFSYDVTAHATLTNHARDKIGRIFVSSEGNFIRLPDSDGTEEWRSAHAMRIEFDMHAHSEPRQGLIKLDVVLMPLSSLMRIREFKMTNSETKDDLETAIQPIINTWIEIDHVDDAEILASLDSSNIVGALYKAVRIIKNGITTTETGNTLFLPQYNDLVVVTGEKSSTPKQEDRMFTFVVNEKIAIRALEQALRNTENALMKNEQQIAREIIQSLNTNGTLSIDNDTGVIRTIMIHTTLPADDTALKKLVPNDTLITVEVDGTFDDYGKTFTIGNPTETRAFSPMLNNLIKNRL